MQPTAGATLHLWRGSTLADQDPRRLPTEALAEACRVQAERFMHDQANDDSFALELFRRAACDGDGGAWDGLVECYRSFVLIHLHRHPAWPSRTESDDDYWVMRTFQRFWRAVSGDRLQRFPTLAAVLTYLKLCAHSVLLDDVRAAAASQTSSLDGVSERLTSDQDVATEVIGRLSGQRVWQIVLAETQGRQEPVVARLSWARRMKPSQIYAAHPELFDSVAEVYRIKRNLVERLRRNPRLAELQN